MTFTPENIFFLGAVLIFASIVISKWGYRFGVPTLLLFLFTGMLFGSDGLGLEFHSHEDAQLIGMLSLSVILFSGGMDTKRRDIEPVATQGLMLSEESLSGGNQLKDMHFPQGTLVMMVKRGNSFIVPNGQLELKVGDILLTIANEQMAE